MCRSCSVQIIYLICVCSIDMSIRCVICAIRMFTYILGDAEQFWADIFEIPCPKQKCPASRPISIHIILYHFNIQAYPSPLPSKSIHIPTRCDSQPQLQSFGPDPCKSFSGWKTATLGSQQLGKPLTGRCATRKLKQTADRISSNPFISLWNIQDVHMGSHILVHYAMQFAVPSGVVPNCSICRVATEGTIGIVQHLQWCKWCNWRPGGSLNCGRLRKHTMYNEWRWWSENWTLALEPFWMW